MGSCFREAEPIDFTQVPRFPDDQGIVTQVDFTLIELDNGREYKVSPAIQSFSTYTGQMSPLLSWKDKYVHLGVEDGETAVWIAGIGVLDRSVDPPVVYYTNGIFRNVDEQGRAMFADGTVLRLAEGVETPPANSRVTAVIDPRRHIIVRFTPIDE